MELSLEAVPLAGLRRKDRKVAAAPVLAWGCSLVLTFAIHMARKDVVVVEQV